ncbi:hypothetical protein P389DRAFT_164788 [Cystobasidium minutum MCA 4210]|uniref:uncharacterized protein n=1 Tax=Cystobasidium minutum MCA 4210 TaxID=1397322 RepID=UPI0034CFE185|eukprot:jgi/Rhomi1/164788/fgenesh1_kg.1_\
MSGFQQQPPQGMPALPGVGPHPGPGGRAHLYIGNLSPRVNEPMLGEIFSVYGPVIGIKLIPDRNFQHNGLNYGFVEFQSLQAAENALQALNGRTIFDTEIKVNWAYQNTQSNKEDLSNHFHVFVGDLAPEINDATLRKAFAAFGSLTDARVMWDLNTGKSRGYGFLAFAEKPDAEQAISAMNGEWLGSRAIRVNWANQRTGAEGGMPSGGAQGGPVRISNLPPFLGPPGVAQPQVGAGPPPGMENAPPPNQVDPNPIPGSGLPDGRVGPPPQRGPEAAQKLIYDVVVQQAPPSNSTVYVGNLSPSTQISDLVPLFQGFGYIVETRLQAEKGYAFIKLDTHQNAATAIVNMNGTSVNGRPIKCAWGRDKLGSDTSIIASQANEMASMAAAAPYGGYAGWPYGGFNPVQQQQQQQSNGNDTNSAILSYYNKYYNPGGISA